MHDEYTMSASEALFGFMGWLTTRDGTLEIGAFHATSGEVVNLIVSFCETNGLEEPRDGWEEHLVHPEEKEGIDE